ncbi:hypothetical protein BD770DRAFT_324456 [Pilaira anomala]|nr:hypothetical protein BD770DRAFT_324456 [Pilaira anomala]
MRWSASKKKNSAHIFRSYVVNLKNDSYTVIGYFRKSKVKNKEDEVIKLLNGMVLSLQQRSLVNEIYMTVVSL